MYSVGTSIWPIDIYQYERLNRESFLLVENKINRSHDFKYETFLAFCVITFNLQFLLMYTSFTLNPLAPPSSIHSLPNTIITTRAPTRIHHTSKILFPFLYISPTPSFYSLLYLPRSYSGNRPNPTPPPHLYFPINYKEYYGDNYSVNYRNNTLPWHYSSLHTAWLRYRVRSNHHLHLIAYFVRVLKIWKRFSNAFGSQSDNMPLACPLSIPSHNSLKTLPCVHFCVGFWGWVFE